MPIRYLTPAGLQYSDIDEELISSGVRIAGSYYWRDRDNEIEI